MQRICRFFQRIIGSTLLLCGTLFISTELICAAEVSSREELTVKLSAQISAMIKEGKKPKTWMTLFDKSNEFSVDAADTKTISVQVQGNSLPIQWSKLSGKELLLVAKSVAVEDGPRLLLAAEIAVVLELRSEAIDLMGSAVRCDPTLKEQADVLTARLSKLPPLATLTPTTTSITEATPSSKPVTELANNGMSTSVLGKRGKFTPRTERPRVLFDAARLSAVRARATNADGKRCLAWLTGKSGNDQQADEFALAFIMTDEVQFATTAIGKMQKRIAAGPITQVSQFEQLAEVAKVYDWCYSKLTDEQKKSWQSWIIKGYENTKDSYLEGYNNYGVKAAWAFALAGYAIQGDTPRSAELLENAYVKRWKGLILPACKAGMAGGAWAEGEGYGSTTCHALIELAEAARCVEGKDWVAEAPEFFCGRLAFLMFLDQPGVTNGGRRLWINGDMHRRRNWDDALLTRLMLQDMLRGSDIVSYAQTFSELPAASERQFNSMNWIDVMWRDRAIPKKPLDSFKVSHHAWGRGTVLMRSDWSETATHVGFVAGPFINASHGHADAGHFSIWKHGELVTQAGDYRGTNTPWGLNAYKRTVAHNTLLIYDPTEKFTVRHTDSLNDGGQKWTDLESNLEGAKIIAYDARRAYTYVCADLAPAYSDKKVSYVRRQMVYLRPDTVIIADQVVSTNPSFAKVWQCYLTGDATLKDKVFRTTNGKGKLRADVLLPLDCKVKLLGGQDKAIDVFGTKVPQPPKANSEDGPAWRAEVRPGVERAGDVFLVVLRVYEGAEPSAATVKNKGTQMTISIPGAGEVVLNTDGSPGGSVNGKPLTQKVVPLEE